MTVLLGILSAVLLVLVVTFAVLALLMLGQVIEVYHLLPTKREGL